MKKTILFLFTLLSTGILFSQSISFDDLTSIAKSKGDKQYWFFMGKGFSTITPKINGTDTLVNLTKGLATPNEEAVYLGGKLSKVSGTKHTTLTYITANLNYALLLLKQMPKDIKLTSNNLQGTENIYNYETDDFYIQVTITTKAGEYCGFLLVNKISL